MNAMLFSASLTLIIVLGMILIGLINPKKLQGLSKNKTLARKDIFLGGSISTLILVIIIVFNIKNTEALSTAPMNAEQFSDENTKVTQHDGVIEVSPIENKEFQPEELNGDEEKRILDLARNLKTRDGSSVIETIKYVEKNSKNKFKAGEFETAYHRDGSLEGVALNYWVGDSRKTEDAFIDIGWTLTPNRQGFLSVKETAPTLSNEEIDNLTVTHLMNGKDDFLKYVDQLEH